MCKSVKCLRFIFAPKLIFVFLSKVILTTCIVGCYMLKTFFSNYFCYRYFVYCLNAFIAKFKE